jgi:pimeloyl-ACP methyl ester carboxylesterase
MATPNEKKLHVEDSGSGEPVLLLHSSGLSGRQWRRLAAELGASGMRVVVPDLSGHGRSEPWPEPTPFSFRTDVERVVEILREVGPAHVVGHSYGGFLALHAALALNEAPNDQVRSLSLFEPVAFGALDPQDAGDANALEVLATFDMSWGPTAEDRERWLKAFVEFWSGPGAWAALREEARAEFRRVGWVVRQGVLSMTEDTAPFAAFGALRAPVQLITGEHSPAPAGRVVERLGAAIPGARVAIIAEAGHMGPLSHAEAVNRVVLDATSRAGEQRIESGTRPA